MGEKDRHAAADRVRPVKTAAKPKQMEHLNRGLVAVKTKKGVFLSWRLLGTDPEETAFNLYRNGQRINSTPISSSTNFLDKHGNGKSLYYVSKVLGDKEVETSPKTAVWQKPYLEVPLNKPDGGTTPDGAPYTYSANDASIGDLDGDGKAEIAMKTADGTVDGTGRVIGDQAADYRNEDGRILAGPEYLSIFHGETGRELATVDYDPPRGRLEDWGDGYGNRMDRFLAGIAYLDGERPSLVMARGYYTRTVLVAYNFRDGKLTKLWTFDSDKPGNEGYAGQGNHSLSVADVDGDGKDEIIYGAMAVDHDGTGLYTTGLGHGDAMHVSDLDPDRPGLEVFQVHEDPRLPYGLSFRDAGTGEILWGEPADTDVGRGIAAHIDPRYKGALVWAIDPPGNEGKSYGLYTSKGEKLSDAAPASANFAIWWDGDLLRELLDHDWKEPAGIPKIDKWVYHSGRLVNLLTADGTLSNNWTKGTPVLQANLFGDWREDVVFRTVRSDALRIYTTTEPTEHRFYTFMHDPVYRLGVAWQNVAYNQPPHPGFYVGTGMDKPPRPNIYTVPCKRNEE
ncbi:rhamnogalacturonan lyase [Bacillus licheniformis]|uniref:rhamnogalacturonan lyase n=1 Tax=Bacillus licheniformis TaxID=1402 RepID=UPI0007414DF0|nr:rhamnogalacturonan lyase [Bacillus licheniformis]KUL12479.1 rhamnogalacturonate lyase [Bacillus licheniformis LMG 17339]TWN17301.1 hypothetical protein CHCC14564_1866 [Bacillus licheniformis LMG 17339]